MSLPPLVRIWLYIGGAVQSAILVGMYVNARHIQAYVRVALLGGWFLVCVVLCLMLWYDFMFAAYPPLRDTLWTINALILCFVPTFCLVVTRRIQRGTKR